MTKRTKGQKIAIIGGICSMVCGLSVIGGIYIMNAIDEKNRTAIVEEVKSNFVLKNEVKETAAPTTLDFNDYDYLGVVSQDMQVADKEGAVVVEIPALDISVPIFEGVTKRVLRNAAGHFPETSAIGEGNYCIAGHSSNVYDCIFNNLANVKLGMPIYLYEIDGTVHEYHVYDNFVVEPTEVGVLKGTEDSRLTIVTCTNGGLQRQIVVALEMSAEEYENYVRNQAASKGYDMLRQAMWLSDFRIYRWFEEEMLTEKTEETEGFTEGFEEIGVITE